MNQEHPDLADARRYVQAFSELRSEVAKVIVGQEKVVEQLLLALAARGHAILVGVPGLAKTLLVQSISRALDLSFRRIQFTPDLMPADITGTEVLDRTEEGSRSFRFVEGPVFTNMLLADEINRTPPKTQAALLEAMQERQVTAAGLPHPLPDPFFVLATQNPIEQEGTYPLPEAALDRFLFLIKVDYPPVADEAAIVRQTTALAASEPKPVLSAEDLLRLQELVRAVPVSDSVIEYAVALCRATRPDEGAPQAIRNWVTWGAGPRASQNLILAAKARALMEGAPHASAEDVRAVALPVLRHRVLLNFAAQAEGITTDSIVEQLLLDTDPHKNALDESAIPDILGSSDPS